MDQTIVETDLDNTLNIFVVNKIVVGHTIVDDVRYFYNKKLLALIPTMQKVIPKAC